MIVSQAFVNPNKRTLLSLNGKSSMIIYDSADIDSAIETTVDGCFYANGQVYITLLTTIMIIQLKKPFILF